MATSDVTTHLLDAVERLRPLIKEHAASAEANRQLASMVYEGSRQNDVKMHAKAEASIFQEPTVSLG